MQKALDQMVFWWKTEKLTVCDPECKENWVVETLDPQTYGSFLDAMDKFFVLFKSFRVGLEAKEQAQRKLLELVANIPKLGNYPDEGTSKREFIDYVENVVDWHKQVLDKAEKVFDETNPKSHGALSDKDSEKGAFPVDGTSTEKGAEE